MERTRRVYMNHKFYKNFIKIFQIIPKGILPICSQKWYASNRSIWLQKEECGMASIFDVAKYLLSKSPMSPKKLQKLCYYCEGWSLALRDGKTLFPERMEAWVHGPVCPELYRNYRGYGWDDIPQYTAGNFGNLSSDDKDVIDAVFSAYGNLDGDSLEFLTHNEKPWIAARHGIDPEIPSNELISQGIMREYFVSVAERMQTE